MMSHRFGRTTPITHINRDPITGVMLFSLRELRELYLDWQLQVEDYLADMRLANDVQFYASGKASLFHAKCQQYKRVTLIIRMLDFMIANPIEGVTDQYLPYQLQPLRQLERFHKE